MIVRSAVKVKRGKCPMCNNAYTNVEMVECTLCKKWIHYQCANVGHEVANDPNWKCQFCEMNEQATMTLPDDQSNLTTSNHQTANRMTDTDCNCHVCNDIYSTNDVVNCIKCSRRVHHACADFELDITDGPKWTCVSCKDPKLINFDDLPSAKQHDIALGKSSGLQKSNSVRSVSSKASTIRFQAKMKLIEQEEEILRKQHEILQKKQALLDQLSDDELEEQIKHVNIDKEHQHDKTVAFPDIPVNVLQAKSEPVIRNPTVNPFGSRFQSNNERHFLRPFTEQSDQQPNEYKPKFSRNMMHNDFPVNQDPRTVDNPSLRENYFPQDVRDEGIPKYEAQAIQSYNPLTFNQIATRHTVAKDLPCFSGDPIEWPVFISSFIQTTAACGLTDAENLIRLQRCLKDKAKRAVEAQLTMPSNVPGIIDTLRLLFGRPELIIEHHINEIRKMQPPKVERLETLVEFAIAVKNLCATLRQADMKFHLYNPMLLKELIEKLPSIMKLNWANYKRTSEDPEGISTFSKWLDEVAVDASSVMSAVSFSTYKSSTRSERRKEAINVHEEMERTRCQQTEYELPLHECKVCKGECSTIADCSTFQDCKLRQRWDIVKEQRLCRRCLKRHSYKCSMTTPCLVNDCQRRHHPLLHNEMNQSVSTVANMNHQMSSFRVRFRVLPVILSNNGKQLKTYAFLDEGSTCSLITEDIAKALKLDGERESFCMKWTKNVTRLEENSSKVNLQISGTYQNAPEFNISNARTVSSLDLPVQSLNYEDLALKYIHLKNLPIESYQDVSPKILIGLANWKIALPLKIKEGADHEPLAAKCRLGWTVFASFEDASNSNDPCVYSYHICDCQAESEFEMQQLMKEYITVDNLGISGPKNQTQLQEEERAVSLMSKSTVYSDNRYKTGLLWKYDTFELPDSRPMAMQRLHCLERRLLSNPELEANVRYQMNEYLERGYIRKLSQEELARPVKRVWYLPVFPVRNPNKPHKIRLVWDAAAKVDGVSLNALLLKGIDYNSSLLGVLLRCRERRICVSGDIKEMFHQVNISDEDQQVLRFYWRDCDTTRPPDTYVMQVMTFGATCSPSCAQYIKNQNAMKYVQDYPRAVKSIVENHYVDDLLDSVDTEAEAIQLANEVKFIHQSGGFEIRNWKSNSEEVMNALNKDLPTINDTKNMSPESSAEKILGMWWCLNADEFTFSLRYMKGHEKVLTGQRRPTKRELLRILMSIYDPLGLIAHFLAYLKNLIQELWRSQLDWDVPVDDDHMKAWQVWLEILPQVENLRIQRCYLNGFPNWNDVKVQLHIFTDASEKLCATVAYLRLKKAEEIKCVLIGSKTKVAPIKLKTVPRLELDAAVMGARFSKEIQSHLSVKPEEVIYWSDSKTVLSWLRSDPRQYNKFVAFRIAEVQDNCEVKDWRYVPSRLNVADDATKWSRIPKLDCTDRWFHGPDFLYLDESQWPKDIKTVIKAREELICSHAMAQPLLDTLRFSKWKILLNKITAVVRAFEIWKNKTFKIQLQSGDFTSNEFKRAELLLFKMAQEQVYSLEINHLRKQMNASADKLISTVDKTSLLYKASPYLDDEGILRVRGRIDSATCLNVDTKRPIILPRNHHITQLLVQKEHEELLHQNDETVVNNLRQRFYIPKLRCLLKTVKKNCQRCKILNATPRFPEMSALPMARMSTYTEPFTYVGIDCFGPITVMVGRRTEKRWGVLFTCLTVRAVHVEIAYKLDTDTFIMCLNDFVARRGQPREIFCDRGTNFIGAERLLREELNAIDFKSIAKHFVSPTLKWNFNPPASPHMGGCWERLVRSFKTALYNSLPTRTPTDPLLRSCLTAAEAIINSRPLTYLPLESEESEALTPNHFIRSSSSGNKPIGQFSDDAKILKFNYQCKEQFANKCWKRFISEYLPELNLRSKWHQQVKPLEVGDIVVIIDKDLPRNNYPKGKIIQVQTAADGQVRSATIQTKDGILTRPAVKLAVLDVRRPEVGTTSIVPDDVVPRGGVGKGHDK